MSKFLKLLITGILIIKAQGLNSSVLPPKQMDSQDNSDESLMQQNPGNENAGENFSDNVISFPEDEEIFDEGVEGYPGEFESPKYDSSENADQAEEDEDEQTKYVNQNISN